MSPETVMTIFRHALELITLLVAVVLLPALGVGLVVAMFQAATQINEMTLTFIPKLLVTFLVLLVGGSWMLNLLIEYTTHLFHSIPSLIS